MKLYEIDSQYMEYLYKADSKVLIHNSGNHQRKFIAIKVLINGYKYFVPLSSPDKRDYFNDHLEDFYKGTYVPLWKQKLA